MNSRIQLFLYQNTIPTGLNYESGMLLSTVYFKGAEYPHIDMFNLPNYVGKSIDSITKMMSGINSDSISSECQEKFKNAYCGFEKNLEAIQSSIDKANENFIDDLINCLLNWARCFGSLIGVNLLSEAFEDMLESGTEVGITATLPAAILARIKVLEGRVLAEYNATMAYNIPFENEIEYCVDSIDELQQQLFDRNRRLSAAERRAMAKVIDDLRRRLEIARSQLRDPTVYSAAVQQEVEEIGRLMKEHLKNGSSGVSGFLNKAKDFISTFFSKIKVLLATLASSLARLAPWLAVSVLIACNLKLIQSFSAACQKRLTRVRDLEQIDRYNAANTYYDGMEEIIKSGCCDKPSPCIGASDNNDGSGGDYSSGSGGSHGGGSSCTQGVGLTLLMGNKYIPTYYDNINSNYMNMNNEPTPGVNGFKDNCPPEFNCLTCGLNTIPSEGNRWAGCKENVTTSSGISIPSHKCACGWKPELSSDPCNVGDILDEALGGILSVVRTIPGIIDGVIGTGGGIGI
jgi:hypothetical protein